MEEKITGSSVDVFKDLGIKLNFLEKLYLPFYRFFYHGIWSPIRYKLWPRGQIVFRGWATDEAWNLNHHICKRYIKPLKHLRANLHGYPYRVGMKRWENILDQIIWSFEKTIDDDFFGDVEKTKKVQKGFELFGKYFLNLWD